MGSQSVMGGASQNTSRLDVSRIVEDDAPKRKRGHIQPSHEFQFFVMRHWTLYDSMFHSRYVAAKLNVWRQHGVGALEQLLARQSLALAEAKQPYKHMPTHLKYKVQDMLQNAEDIDRRLGKEVVYESFTRQRKDQEDSCAADLVRSMDGILEDDTFLELPEAEPNADDHPTSAALSAVDAEAYQKALTQRWDLNFSQAFEVFSNRVTFQRGLDQSIKRQRQIVDMGTRLIEKKMIAWNGCFRWATIRQKNNFTNSVPLSKLALFTLDAMRERFPKRQHAPFILCALCDA